MADQSVNKKSAPLRVALVGSGPGGFFCADYLLRLAQPCSVGMFEQYPSPYGLIRGAVAPDHPNIRLAVRAFEKIAEHDQFIYYGNVRVGRDISVTELRRYFDAIIVATGAPESKRLGIEGEHLSGCHAAVSLAGWSNARPDCAPIQPDLATPSAVVIGAGNAALDMVRLLATPPEHLAQTDISSAALETLRGSHVRDIHLVARRGPLDAQYSAQELSLLGEIPDCAVYIHAPGEERSHPKHALAAVYEKLHDRTPGCADVLRCIHLHFYRTPQIILGDTRVEGVVFSNPENKLIHIPCGIVVKSIGNFGLRLEGFPFDEERGIIPNKQGRVVQGDEKLPGVYVAGWIKRGAIGVLGANKPDCRETVQCIMDDRERICTPGKPTEKELMTALESRNIRVVSFADWKKIDAAERRMGVERGKLRERFASVADMLSFLDS